MPNAQPSMVLKFPARDTRLEVTRATVKALAVQLRMSETAVVHFALARLAESMLTSYQRDMGPLTARELLVVRRSAKCDMPKGKLLSVEKLFE